MGPSPGDARRSHPSDQHRGGVVLVPDMVSEHEPSANHMAANVRYANFGMQDVQRVCLAFRRALQHPSPGTYGTVRPAFYGGTVTSSHLAMLADWIVAREAGAQIESAAQPSHRTTAAADA